MGRVGTHLDVVSTYVPRGASEVCDQRMDPPIYIGQRSVSQCRTSRYSGPHFIGCLLYYRQDQALSRDLGSQAARSSLQLAPEATKPAHNLPAMQREHQKQEYTTSSQMSTCQLTHPGDKRYNNRHQTLRARAQNKIRCF